MSIQSNERLSNLMVKCRTVDEFVVQTADGGVFIVEYQAYDPEQGSLPMWDITKHDGCAWIHATEAHSFQDALALISRGEL